LELYHLTIHELQNKLANKEITVDEVLDSHYQRIEDVDDKIKAYVTLTEDEARERAAAGTSGKLSGIPLAIKDNISTEGIELLVLQRY